MDEEYIILQDPLDIYSLYIVHIPIYKHHKHQIDILVVAT